MIDAAKNICVFGSTGSVGENTLDVVSRHPQKYNVFALSANQNIEKLLSQCQQFLPEFVIVNEMGPAKQLASQLSDAKLTTQVLQGSQALNDIASHEDVDIVMAGIVGSAGLTSTLSAIDSGKNVLIANKEPIVMVGGYLIERAKQSGAKIIPVDSEHNAIMQCLPADFCVVNNQSVDHISRILLTGSGGPFRTLPLDQFESITPKQACAHPTWNMGVKISVDSATMMNKALELIEARILFGLQEKQIEIIIHPQSIIHSMVEYCDGSVLAQLGPPDMRVPISSALAWPKRIDSGAEKLDFSKLANLEFDAPDMKRFPLLKLVEDVMRAGGSAPCVMNAANEVAVAAFLDKRIKFVHISDIVEQTLEKSEIFQQIELELVIQADHDARISANHVLKQYHY